MLWHSMGTNPHGTLGKHQKEPRAFGHWGNFQNVHRNSYFSPTLGWQFQYILLQKFLQWITNHKRWSLQTLRNFICHQLKWPHFFHKFTLQKLWICEKYLQKNVNLMDKKSPPVHKIHILHFHKFTKIHGCLLWEFLVLDFELARMCLSYPLVW